MRCDFLYDAHESSHRCWKNRGLVLWQDASRLSGEAHLLEWISAERALADRANTAEGELELKLDFVGIVRLSHAEIGRPAVATRFDPGAVLGFQQLRRSEIIAGREIDAQLGEHVGVSAHRQLLTAVFGGALLNGVVGTHVTISRLQERACDRPAHE